MTATFNKIFAIISPAQRKKMAWLFIAILIMGLLETAGIASIMPFLAVLSNPAIIQTNSFLSKFYEITAVANQTQFLFVLGIGVLVVMICSNAFSAFTNWLLLRFIYFQGHELSCKLFQQYLARPYLFFLNHNSSDLTKNIISEVHRAVVGVLTPTMQITSRSIIALCILGLLIALDPLLAIMVFIICGGSYAAVYILARKKLAERGKITTKTQSQRFKLAGEAFGGIKDLKLLNREYYYLDRYQTPSHDFAVSEATGQAITILPKYALETIVFGGMMLIMLYLIGIKQEMSRVIPVLGLYAFAGYRLMPGFNQIFQGSSQIRYHSAALDIIHDHIYSESADNAKIKIGSQPAGEITFQKEIRLENISFAYPGTESDIIKDLDITIKANATIGIVGTTGSGKSTLIDIILGLLPIHSGKFYVDDMLIANYNIKLWQKNIGYVPQHIYLADDTVTKNIAFGIPDDKINHSEIIKAATMANIHDLIRKDLPQGYDTNLGERGVRLSGGQRQRIGIARALYHDPEVLILDEATSALDGVTESAVMDAINNLAGNKTIIMIAHRVTTVKDCDIIFVMENGKIIARGKYNELITSCDQFRAMAKESGSLSPTQLTNL
jgi:ABC-type multidrug transport system fused ATPase/permease subunit